MKKFQRTKWEKHNVEKTRNDKICWNEKFELADSEGAEKNKHTSHNKEKVRILN